MRREHYVGTGAFIYYVFMGLPDLGAVTR